MLTIVVPREEFYNEQTEEFVIVDEIVLELEHSLVSLSKWESKFEKPFLGPEEKTSEEVLGYVESMILNPKFSPEVIFQLTQENLDQINDYIGSAQSATTFGQMPDRKVKGEIITSELIYYWMVAFNIPFECEHWHLNRLFALIRICNIKNSKQKKMSKHELAARNQELNAKRRAELNTSG